LRSSVIAGKTEILRIGFDYLRREELLLREELELLGRLELPEELDPDDRPNPPEVVGFFAVDDGLLAEDVEEEEEGGEDDEKDRCDCVGVVNARAFAAVFSALGDTAGCLITG